MKMLVWLFVCAAAPFVSNAVPMKLSLVSKANSSDSAYYNGIIDGQMGSQTAAAIRRFQIAKKVESNWRTEFANASPLGSLGAAGRAPVRSPRAAQPTSILQRFSKVVRSFPLGRRRRSP